LTSALVGSEDREQWRALANMATIKYWNILEQLSDWRLVKKGSNP
jgi:hypothetical protein